MQPSFSLELDRKDVQGLWTLLGSLETARSQNNQPALEAIEEQFVKDVEHFANRCFAEGMKLSAKLNKVN